MKFSGRFKSRLEANVGIGGCVSPQPPIPAILNRQAVSLRREVGRPLARGKAQDRG
jgi:hypothetical protein